MARLKSGPEGITAEEAALRLLDYGPNVVEATVREPLIRRFTH
jgi:hypothetical protein